MYKLLERLAWNPKTYQSYKQHLSYFRHDQPIFMKLASQAPIVSVKKIKDTIACIEQCENRKSALLHIGDCAEPFQHAQPQIMRNKIQFLKKCKEVLSSKGKSAHIIGRIAGQYAKPRSSQFVTINGVKTHNYKGDNVNSIHEHDRNPCENKLFQGYTHSLNTANLIEEIFPQLFVSHEGLVLPYEESLTKEIDGKFYCQSAHMIWIGERTRQLNGAHVQFFRGIENPIGIKISSNITESEFLQLVRTLNPQNKKGKLLVIIRMGHEKIKDKLKSLVQIKQNQGLNFLFVTDPMHANTHDSKEAKVKTRSLQHIVEEIKYFEQTMKDKHLPYGYSFQATFEDVTECYGLAHPVTEKEIQQETYKSKCDPRLNREQTLKLLNLLEI